MLVSPRALKSETRLFNHPLQANPKSIDQIFDQHENKRLY